VNLSKERGEKISVSRAICNVELASPGIATGPKTHLLDNKIVKKRKNIPSRTEEKGRHRDMFEEDTG